MACALLVAVLLHGNIVPTADACTRTGRGYSERIGGRVQLANTANTVPLLQQVPIPLAAQCPTAPNMSALSSVGAITSARASSAWCAKSDGTFVAVSSNVPRIGHFGILNEYASTQLLTAPRDMTNAAWTKTSVTAAQNAVGADGVAASATTLTATGSNGTVLQTTVLSSAMRAASGSVRRVTGTGTVSFTMDNGSTWCDVTTKLATAMANGCTWLRVSQYADDWHDTAAICFAGCGAESQNIANPSVGWRLGTNGDVVVADFMQLEAGAYATSPISGASRAVDDIRLVPTASFPVAAGYIEMNVTPLWVGNTHGAGDFRTPFDGRNGSGSGDGEFAYYQVSTPITYGVRNSGAGSSTTVTNTAPASAWVGDLRFNKPGNWRIEWDSTRIRYRFNGVTKSTVAAVTNVPAGLPSPFRLGALYDGSLNLLGYIGNIRTSPVVVDDVTAVATVGDSIMRGAFDVMEGSALQAAIVGKRVFASPYAVSGDTTVGCTTQYTTYVAGTDVDVIVNDCGINNLLSGESAATAWSNMQTLLDTMRTAGYRIIAVNITPCAGYATCSVGVQANITTVNASLAAWCATYPATCTLVNMNSILGNGNSLKAACLDEPGADFLHPDNSCSIEYANAIGAAL